MNYLFKRRIFVKRNLNNIKTVFRSITRIEIPNNGDNYNKNDNYSKNKNRKTFYRTVGAGSITVISLGLYSIFTEQNRLICAAPKSTQIEEDELQAGIFKPNLQTYSLDEIVAHNTKEKRIWVIYKEGVYDVTDFVESHPGGEIILQASGGSIEPFWTIYGIHKCKEVYEMLECLRIGNVTKKDSEELSKNLKDPYLGDPPRSKYLKPASTKPYNAEPSPTSLLVEEFYTPNDVFYVRNHLPVPVVDIETYKLEIEIEGTNKKLELTMDELKQFERHHVTAALMCAGNRRSEMSKVRQVKGLNWGQAVIGNAVWTGVYLKDILTSMGINEDAYFNHVQFEGLDVDPNIKGRFYGASVPFNFVMDKNSEVIVAYEMNGEPLPRDHGFPVRMIIPGVCGARNVKWLAKIVVSKEESKAFWQQNDYKSFNSSTEFDSADYSKAQAIQRLPVTSAICLPQNGDTVQLQKGFLTVKGYAYSGGGSEIYRVDVTPDRGTTWYTADLKISDEKPPHHYGWALWTVKIPIDKEKDEVELWAKAVDSNHNTQPESFEHIWNIRGVLANAYHRIKVKIQK